MCLRLISVTIETYLLDRSSCVKVLLPFRPSTRYRIQSASNPTLENFCIKGKMQILNTGLFFRVRGNNSKFGIMTNLYNGIITYLYSGIITNMYSGIITYLYSGIITNLYSGIITNLYSGIITNLYSGIITNICILE